MAGNLVKQTAANGAISAFVYNGKNQLVKEIDRGGVIDWEGGDRVGQDSKPKHGPGPFAGLVRF